MLAKVCSVIRKPVITVLIFLAACLTAPGVLHSQITTKFDQEFFAQADSGLVMGNLLIAQQGKIVYEKSFGLQDIENAIPNTQASSFALASISKQFTATAILQLSEKGKLNLDDPLTKYFPDFPFAQITIRHLLTHTSGLPEYELFDELIKKEPEKVFGNPDIIPALKVWTKGLYFKPGDDWRYSNVNYCLLALVVEKVSGESFTAYLKRHIFEPAGMKHTYLENYLVKTANPNRTVNYEYPTYFASKMERVELIPFDKEMIQSLGGFYGQGGLTSTAEDLLRFDNAFFANKLLSASSVQLALSPAQLNNGRPAEAYKFGVFGASGYGMGWFILSDTSKGQIVWHDGSRPGISTVHLHNLKTNQTVILLQNTPEPGNDSAICAYQMLNGGSCLRPSISLIRIYGQTLIKDGPEAADAKLETLRQNPLYKMPEDYMWMYLGYQLMEKKEYLPLSIEVFKKAAALFPNAWYITQGYAAALAQAGETEQAILLYKKCLAQNPQNDFAKEQIKLLQAKPTAK
jgi:CubicO group peptidase (beta-lactamase class C family)